MCILLNMIVSCIFIPVNFPVIINFPFFSQSFQFVEDEKYFFETTYSDTPSFPPTIEDMVLDPSKYEQIKISENKNSNLNVKLYIKFMQS